MVCGFLHCVSICIENYAGSGVAGALPGLICPSSPTPTPEELLGSCLHSCSRCWGPLVCGACAGSPTQDPELLLFICLFVFIFILDTSWLCWLQEGAVLHLFSEWRVIPAWWPRHRFNQLSSDSEKGCVLPRNSFHPAIPAVDKAEDTAHVIASLRISLVYLILRIQGIYRAVS